MSTTAKLAELLKVLAHPDPGCPENDVEGCAGCKWVDADVAIHNAAPDLARLVLTLAEALAEVEPLIFYKYPKARKALAAVEELRL